MSNFDKMIKLIEEKDIKGMEEWLHPDFLFVVDYEMETREEWLKDTKRLFEEEDYYNGDNSTNNNDNENSIGEDHDRPLPASFISRSTEEQQVLRQV